jgi:hypothetical protein
MSSTLECIKTQSMLMAILFCFSPSLAPHANNETCLALGVLELLGDNHDMTHQKLTPITIVCF